MGDIPQMCPRCGQSHLVVTGIHKTIDEAKDPRKQFLLLASFLMVMLGCIGKVFWLIGTAFMVALVGACLPPTKRTKLSCPSCHYDTFADELPR